MKIWIALYLLVALGAGAVCAQETNTVVSPVAPEKVSQSQILSAIEGGNIDAMKSVLEKVGDPVAKLYLQACVDRLEGKPEDALKKVAEVVAFHYQDMDWLPYAELLCAELYDETGMTNAAAVTARQIGVLYKGTEFAKKADALRSKIEEGGSDEGAKE